MFFWKWSVDFAGNMDVVDVRKRKERMRTSCPLGAADNTEEIRRAFQAGRMDVLFNFVDSGRISLEEAAKFACFSMETAEDMLLGWREAQER